VIEGQGLAQFPVSISVDGGKTWASVGTGDRLDATDRVKGHSQYRLRIGAAAARLTSIGLTMRTVCQTNVSTIPHLHDGVNRVTFEASGLALASAGPTQAEARVVEGKIGSSAVTLELAAPRGEPSLKLYAESWQASGAPPAPVKYQIEYSVDGGKSWGAVVKDWQVTRRTPEPPDFWSQSFAWGETALPAGVNGPVRVRFRNDGKKTYRNVEAHLAYRVAQPSATEVTFGWRDAAGPVRTVAHTYPAGTNPDATWSFDAGQKVGTQWVEYSVK
jgi:hypothetical protein